MLPLARASTYTMPRPTHCDDLHWQDVTKQADAAVHALHGLPPHALDALVKLCVTCPEAVSADLVLLAARGGL